MCDVVNNNTHKQTEESVIPVDHQLLKYLLRKRKYRGIETGGILGSSQGVITHYYHDEGGKQTDGGYFPNSEDLNWIIAQWKRVGIEFGALLCVHAPDAPAPSVSNLWYVSAILSFNPRLPEVLLGIMADGQLIFFRFERDFLSTGTGSPFSTGYDTIEKQQEVTP